jgi:RNA polymerase sigma-70 factor (ECF subfamily)
LNLLTSNERKDRENDTVALGALIEDELTPELAAVCRRHGDAFQKALERSLESLDRRDKTLLRLHFVDELSIDAIGRIYRVHRATVARRLVAVRRRIFDHLRADLSLRLGATNSEFRSILAALRTDLELSLRHLLPVGGGHER